jgi:hypothetical protein
VWRVQCCYTTVYWDATLDLWDRLLWSILKLAWAFPVRTEINLMVVGVVLPLNFAPVKLHSVITKKSSAVISAAIRTWDLISKKQFLLFCQCLSQNVFQFAKACTSVGCFIWHPGIQKTLKTSCQHVFSVCQSLYKCGVFYLALWYPEDSENQSVPRTNNFKIRAQ